MKTQATVSAEWRVEKTPVGLVARCDEWDLVVEAVNEEVLALNAQMAFEGLIEELNRLGKVREYIG